MMTTMPTTQTPYVRNTFVCVDVPRELPAARARSLSPRGGSDIFARQLHSLLYRPTPVRERTVEPAMVPTPEVVEEKLKLKISAKILQRGEETDLNSSLGSRSTDTGGGDSSAVDSVESSPRSAAELSEEELLRIVPRDEAGNPLSLGSVGHEEGTCKPCVFAYNENKRCGNGLRCAFCHYQHPPKKRVRLCKKKRMELRRQQEEEGGPLEEEY